MYKEKSINFDNLKLNSYKIDSKNLQQSLKQLNDMRSELETTISQYKVNEQNLIQENQRLRDQIKMLQKKLNEKVEHTQCENKIRLLNEEIAQKNQEIQKYKSMFDVERRNKAELARFYDNKFDSMKTDSKLLVENYENKIANLKAEVALVRSSQIDLGDNWGKKQQSSKYPSIRDVHTQKSDIQAQSYHSNFYKKEPSIVPETRQRTQGRSPNIKTTSNIPPKSPTVKQFKTSNEIKKNMGKSILESQELFQTSVRKLYQQIKQMGIKPKDALILPQFKKINSEKKLTKTDLISFLKNPPIEEKNAGYAQNAAQYLQKIVKQKYGELKGKFVTETIIKKVEEYNEADSNIDSDDLEISGMTPSNNHGISSYGYSSVSNQKGPLIAQNQAVSMPNRQKNPYDTTSRPSIADALYIESDF